MPDQKIPIYFYYTKKTCLVNYVQKQYSKVPVGKLKIGFNLVEGPMEIMQIRAFSKHSYERTKANLQFIFTGFVAQFSKFLSSYILSLFRLSLYFLHPYKESNVLCFDDTVNFTIFLTRMTGTTEVTRDTGMTEVTWVTKMKGTIGTTGLAWINRMNRMTGISGMT